MGSAHVYHAFDACHHVHVMYSNRQRNHVVCHRSQRPAPPTPTHTPETKALEAEPTADCRNGHDNLGSTGWSGPQGSNGGRPRSRPGAGRCRERGSSEVSFRKGRSGLRFAREVTTQIGPGPSRSTSLQISAPMAPILAQLRTLNAHFGVKCRATLLFGFGRIVALHW